MRVNRSCAGFALEEKRLYAVTHGERSRYETPYVPTQPRPSSAPHRQPLARTCVRTELRPRALVTRLSSRARSSKRVRIWLRSDSVNIAYTVSFHPSIPLAEEP